MIMAGADEAVNRNGVLRSEIEKPKICEIVSSQVDLKTVRIVSLRAGIPGFSLDKFGLIIEVSFVTSSIFIHQ